MLLVLEFIFNIVIGNNNTLLFFEEIEDYLLALAISSSLSSSSFYCQVGAEAFDLSEISCLCLFVCLLVIITL